MNLRVSLVNIQKFNGGPLRISFVGALWPQPQTFKIGNMNQEILCIMDWLELGREKHTINHISVQCTLYIVSDIFFI